MRRGFDEIRSALRHTGQTVHQAYHEEGTFMECKKSACTAVRDALKATYPQAEDSLEPLEQFAYLLAHEDGIFVRHEGQNVALSAMSPRDREETFLKLWENEKLPVRLRSQEELSLFRMPDPLEEEPIER